ncbi:MAG: hypothetical protein EOP21_00940 [Hyphomicrobiales bacterium]|nr:MAG: hypothetical protein EOP21_00940 [Hyphomicrobiales bacterium]
MNSIILLYKIEAGPCRDNKRAALAAIVRSIAIDNVVADEPGAVLIFRTILDVQEVVRIAYDGGLFSSEDQIVALDVRARKTAAAGAARQAGLIDAMLGTKGSGAWSGGLDDLFDCDGPSGQNSSH